MLHAFIPLSCCIYSYFVALSYIYIYFNICFYSCFTAFSIYPGNNNNIHSSDPEGICSVLQKKYDIECTMNRYM